jgi:hypothetical protein
MDWLRDRTAYDGGHRAHRPRPAEEDTYHRARPTADAINLALLAYPHASNPTSSIRQHEPGGTSSRWRVWFAGGVTPSCCRSKNTVASLQHLRATAGRRDHAGGTRGVLIRRLRRDATAGRRFDPTAGRRRHGRLGLFDSSHRDRTDHPQREVRRPTAASVRLRDSPRRHPGGSRAAALPTDPAGSKECLGRLSARPPENTAYAAASNAWRPPPPTGPPPSRPEHRPGGRIDRRIPVAGVVGLPSCWPSVQCSVFLPALATAARSIQIKRTERTAPTP